MADKSPNYVVRMVILRNASQVSGIAVHLCVYN